MLPPEEYYLLLEHVGFLRIYKERNIISYSDIHNEFSIMGYNGRVLVKKSEDFVEYEDVKGFFGFSSVGTEIAS